MCEFSREAESIGDWIYTFQKLRWASWKLRKAEYQSEVLRTRRANGVIANMSLSTANYPLPRAFASDWTATGAFVTCLCCCSCWPLTLLEENSGWRALCAPGKLEERVFRKVDIFRNWFHDPNPCTSSYLESTKSLHGGISSLWLAENLLWRTWLHWTRPSPKLPHCLFGAVSQSYLRCCLPGCSSYFVPNKI